MNRRIISCDHRLATLLVCCSAVIGCQDTGSNQIPVSGKITVGGEPLKLGVITFNPKDSGRSGFGKINPDGTYQISSTGTNDGLAPGEYVVTIDASETKAADEVEVPKTLEEEMAGVGAVVAGNQRVQVRHHAPPKYASKEQSPLKAVVNSESKTFNFELE